MPDKKHLILIFKTAVASIDETFGEGYSKKNPQLIVALLSHISGEEKSQRSTHINTGVKNENIGNQPN
ncbi:MAG: hypothetical protein HOO06_13730 [Bdellovibrionaceae bacterium]|nr:hypothetical protein [Pseudobdellovibrionaceae bacterium]